MRRDSNPQRLFRATGLQPGAVNRICVAHIKWRRVAVSICHPLREPLFSKQFEWAHSVLSKLAVSGGLDPQSRRTALLSKQAPGFPDSLTKLAES